MGSVPSTFRYRLDAEAVILSVGDDWLRFPRENGAAELSRDSLLARSVWEFVAGDTTRELYEMMFRRILDSNESLLLPFRCDSAELPPLDDRVCPDCVALARGAGEPALHTGT